MRHTMTAVIVLAMMALTLIAGCTNSQRDAALQGSSVAGQLAAADRLLQSGDVEQTVLSVSIRGDELDTLTRAFEQYEESREIISTILDNPDRAMQAISIIRDEHARLTQAYLDVQSVVMDNWDEYSAVAQARLDRWRGQVERLEITYQRMAEAVESARSESARTERIIELARIVAQIALMAV